MTISFPHPVPREVFVIASALPPLWLIIAAGACAFGVLAFIVATSFVKRTVWLPGLALTAGALVITLGFMADHWMDPHPITSSKAAYLSADDAEAHFGDVAPIRSSHTRFGPTTTGPDTTGYVAKAIRSTALPESYRISGRPVDWSIPAYKDAIDKALRSKYGVVDLGSTMYATDKAASDVDSSNGIRMRTLAGKTTYCLPVLSDLRRDRFDQPVSVRLAGLVCEDGQMRPISAD